MAQNWNSWCQQLGLVSALGIAGTLMEFPTEITASPGNYALAQIKPDATLGSETSVITLLGDFGLLLDQIEGGAKRGANLFHSFEEFNVGDGQRVYFANPAGIKNILSRVTGNNRSDIQGTLGVLGNANLFLINPNGIIFGPNARLDVNGSFLASTASSLNFDNNAQFSATNPQAISLLTVSVPIGLQFEGRAGNIISKSSSQSFDSSLQQVRPGKTLALVGGDVSLDNFSLNAESGRVEIAGVEGPGVIGLNISGNELSLTFPDTVARADVLLTNGTTLNLSSNDIQVLGRRIVLTNGSRIVADALESEPGETLVVAASESLELIGTGEDGLPSGLFTQTEGAEAAGDLRIVTGQLSVRDGAQVGAGSLGKGAGGTLNVLATDFVELSGTSPDGSPSGLFTQALGNGNAGDLRITTGQLSVRDRAVASVSSQGAGNAGTLEVAARSVWLDNRSALRAESVSGEGGNIKLQTQDLLLMSRGSDISAVSFGNEGNITIDTDLLVALENSDITASAEGPGANVQITAQGIFGSQAREQLTPESDITSSSQLIINTSNDDPSSGLVALSEEVVDVGKLVVQRCPVGGGAAKRKASKFVVTGRGGLPPSPSDPPSSDVVLADWITLDPEMEEKGSSPAPVTSQTSSTLAPIVEAQGWVRGPGGEIVLTAQAPTVTPHNPGVAPASCQRF